MVLARCWDIPINPEHLHVIGQQTGEIIVFKTPRLPTELKQGLPLQTCISTISDTIIVIRFGKS